jgi:hypothetical protein
LGQHERRGPRVLAMAVMAGIAVTAAQATAAATAQATATPTANEWHVPVVMKPGTAVFDAAVATSPASAWAVGAVYGKTFATGPIAAHWDGVRWSRVTIPGSSGYTLTSVAASSASNVWVTAMRTTSVSTTIFRFDGARWHRVSPPDFAGGLMVFGPRDVWMSGAQWCDYTHPGNVPYGCTTKVWHWNGSRWTDHQVGAFFYGLAGSSDRDLWGVTYTGLRQPDRGPGTLTAYHWDGGKWRKAALPHVRGDVQYGAGIAMDGSRSVWLTAMNVADTAAVILHLSNGKWQKFAGPDTAGAPTPDGQGGIWLGSGERWTGGKWVDTSAVAWPKGMTSAGGPGQPVRIPGAPGSFWATGTIDVKPPGVSGAAVFSYGPMPSRRASAG